MTAQMILFALVMLTLINVVVAVRVGRIRKAAFHDDGDAAAARVDWLQKRADAIADASRQACRLAEQAWRAGDAEARRFWMDVQIVCSAEIQDVALAMKAETP